MVMPWDRGASGPQRWVGLDLGSQSMKLAEMEQTGSGLRLVKRLIQELPAPEPGRAVDRLGWLQTALKEFEGQPVHVALSGPEVALRRVWLPLMSAQELREGVRWQVKEHIPFPVQDAVLDVQVIGEVWDKDIRKQDVLVAAASKSYVQEIIALIERAGGTVASLVPSHVAAWRCAHALVPDAPQGSAAVIEVGASKTEVTIIKDGHIRLTRDLGVGSQSLTEALVGVVASEQGQTAIDRARAETLKRRYGILAQEAGGTTEDGVPLFHLSSLMRPVLEHLLTELSRVLNFYKVQTDEAGVSRALLCGGGATLKQLQPFLADGLGVTVEVLNPLLRIPQVPQPADASAIAEDGPRLAVAVGAALQHGQALNLLPADARQAKAAAASRHTWRAALRRAGAVAAAAYVGLWCAAGMLEWKLRSHRQVWGLLQPAYAQSLKTTQATNTLNGTVGQLEQFLARQPVWDGVMKELGALMPAAIELGELSLQAGTGHDSPVRFWLKGRAVSAGPAGEGGIDQLMTALEQSAFFEDVELASSEMRSGESGGTSFEIEGALE